MTPTQLRILLASCAELIDIGTPPKAAIDKTMLTAYQTGLVFGQTHPEPHVPQEILDAAEDAAMAEQHLAVGVEAWDAADAEDDEPALLVPPELIPDEEPTP